MTEAQKAITAPETFDIFGGYNYQDIQAWSAGNLMPIDTKKIAAWPQLYKLFAWGKVNPDSKTETYGDGDAPFRALFLKQGTSGLPLTKEAPKSNKDIVQWIDESTGRPDSGSRCPATSSARRRTSMPTRSVTTPTSSRKQPNKVGWEELLNKKWQGKVALLKDPGIVMQDIGNALKALGIFKPKDMGNMTTAEIDRVVKVATTYKKAGQFRAYWANFNESVNLMASKEVVIESMWSPAVALLVAQGMNVRYAAPPTGFRGWCSSNGIAAHVGSDPGEAAGLLRLPELDVQRLARRHDHAPGLLHRQRPDAAQVDRQVRRANPAGGIPFQPTSTTSGTRQARCSRPARDHRQGRGHQEGLGARRRLVRPAHRPLLVVELLLHEQHVPDQALERLPQRLSVNV